MKAQLDQHQLLLASHEIQSPSQWSSQSTTLRVHLRSTRETKGYINVRISLFILLLSALTSFAANQTAPSRMSYQGYLKDGNGAALASSTPTNYEIEFRIYDAASVGNVQWSEKQTVTVDKGYFSVLLGEGSVIGSEPRPSLSKVFAGATASDRYVGMTVKGVAGNREIAPRLRLLAGPYSFLAQNARTADHAKIADSLTDGTGKDTINYDGKGGTVKVAKPTEIGGKLTVRLSGSTGTLVDMRSSSGANSMEVDSDSFNFKTGKNAFEFDKPVRAKGVVQSTSGDLKLLGEKNTEALRVKANNNRVGIGKSNPQHPLHVGGNAKVDGTMHAGTFAGNGVIPKGGIIMWSGSIARVPNGWALCNGATVSGMRTPDLRNRFVVGAGSAYKVGATGGANTVKLTIAQMPKHSHNISILNRQGNPDGWGDNGRHYWRNSDYPRNRTTDQGKLTDSVGGDQAHENRPPYYALAFIMRVK